MKESPTDIFKSIADLRLILTSNFNHFVEGENLIDEFVKVTYNGDEVNYDFKVETLECTFNINKLGMPTFSYSYENVIAESAFEACRSIYNWIKNKEYE